MDHARRVGAAMKGRAAVGIGRVFSQGFLGVAVVFVSCFAQWSHAQDNGFERAFSQSKAMVEKALREMQPATAGRLPVLDGFASSDHPLDHYQRGYYQAKFQVTAAPSGGSTVRVSVQVTAWYADPAGGHSGYQVLASNGRLEADLLDQLADQLAGKGQQFGAGAPASAARQPFPSERAASDRSLSGQIPPGQTPPSAPSPSEPSPSEQSPSSPAAKVPDSPEPTISAPAPRLPEVGGGISSALAQTLSDQEKA